MKIEGIAKKPGSQLAPDSLGCSYRNDNLSDGATETIASDSNKAPSMPLSAFAEGSTGASPLEENHQDPPSPEFRSFTDRLVQNATRHVNRTAEIIREKLAQRDAEKRAKQRARQLAGLRSTLLIFSPEGQAERAHQRTHNRSNGADHKMGIEEIRRLARVAIEAGRQAQIRQSAEETTKESQREARLKSMSQSLPQAAGLALPSAGEVRRRTEHSLTAHNTSNKTERHLDLADAAELRALVKRAEDKLQAEQRARMLFEEKLKTSNQARLEAESEVKKKNEELRAEVEARMKVEREREEAEVARKRAEEVAKTCAEQAKVELRARVDAEQQRQAAERAILSIQDAFKSKVNQAEEEQKARISAEGELQTSELARRRTEEEAKRRLQELQAEHEVLLDAERLRLESEFAQAKTEYERKHAEQAKQWAATDEMRRTDFEARLLAESEGRLSAECKLKEIEEAQRKSTKTTKKDLKKESRLVEEIEARIRAEYERKQVEEAQERAEIEAKRTAEYEARQRDETEARLKAQQETAFLKEEQEARLKAERERQEFLEQVQQHASLLKEEREARLKAERERQEFVEQVQQHEALLKEEQEARLQAERERHEFVEQVQQHEALLKEEQEARLQAERERQELSKHVQQQAVRQSEETAARLKIEFELKQAKDEAQLKALSLTEERKARADAERELKRAQEMAKKTVPGAELTPITVAEEQSKTHPRFERLQVESQPFTSGDATVQRHDSEFRTLPLTDSFGLHEPGLMESPADPPLKRCSKCFRAYKDEILAYCLYDAAPLVTETEMQVIASKPKDNAGQQLFVVIVIVFVFVLLGTLLLLNFGGSKPTSTSEIQSVNQVHNAVVESMVIGALAGKETGLPVPEYPAAAKTERVSGQVDVEIRVNKMGTVTHAEAVNGPRQLEAAAVNAAKKTRFDPEKLNQPSRLSGVIRYTFKL